MSDDPLLAPYEALLRQLDAHAHRVHSTWGDHFACAAGCSGCCRGGLTVFAVEAAAIAAWAAHRAGSTEPVSYPGAPGLPPRDVSPQHGEGGDCSLLDDRGRCTIYPARPVICRSHGLPLALRSADGGLTGDVCPLNFTEGLGVLSSSDFLDLDTINTVLVQINRDYCAAAGVDGDARVSLEGLGS